MICAWGISGTEETCQLACHNGEEACPVQHVYPSIVSPICVQLTCVVPHPHRKAISCASNSPKPSIMPLTNGSNRFIAAPLAKLQNVGGLYTTTLCSWLLSLLLLLLLLLVLEEDCGGEVDGGDSDENASDSEGIVRPEEERSWGCVGSSSNDILKELMLTERQWVSGQQLSVSSCWRKHSI
jgi:hypothetical protein